MAVLVNEPVAPMVTPSKSTRLAHGENSASKTANTERKVPRGW
jgi:hypothetical protein